MKIEKILNDYLEIVKLYQRHGTLTHYQQSYKLMSRCLKELKLKDSKQLNKVAFNKIVEWYKTNTTKKNRKINDAIVDLRTALNSADIPLKFRAKKLTDDTTPFKPLPENELNKLVDHLKSLDLDHSNNLVWVTTVLLMLDTGARKNEAQQIYLNGCPLPSIQLYLGHSSVVTTMVYLDIDSFLLNKDYNHYYPYSKSE